METFCEDGGGEVWLKEGKGEVEGEKKWWLT